MQHKNINLLYQDSIDSGENSLSKKRRNHVDHYNIFDKNINYNFEKCDNCNRNVLLKSKDERKESCVNASMFSKSIQRNCSKLLESDVETTFSDRNNKKKYNDEISSDSTSKMLYKSKHEAKNTSKGINASQLTLKEKLYCDKTTYCRPVLNFYNQQFIYKTIQKNTQLKRLVRKLALERQQEKENVTWNNYINELKNRHGIYSNVGKSNMLPQEHRQQHAYEEIIDDYYNTKFTWTQSVPCRNLLDDMYGTHSTPQSTCIIPPIIRGDENNQPPFEHRSFCYPTCSQGRLIALEREKQFNEYANRWNNHSRDRNDNNITILNKTGSKTKQCFKLKSPGQVKSSFVQTDKSLLEENEFQHKFNCKSISVKEEICKIAEIATTQRVKDKNDINTKPNSLTSIENKLEALIESINKFIGDVRLKNTPYLENKGVTCKINKKINKKAKGIKSDLESISKTHNIIGNKISDSSGSTLAIAEIISQFNQTLPSIKNENEILFSNTNNSVDSKYIEQYFNKQLNQQCSVQIPFEVPTKDCFTEVTKSLSKQVLSSGDKKGIVDEQKRLDNPTAAPCMAIAVNTDPLSLLSLLRISTDTIRQLLSYMPNINYQSYLSMLHFPYVIGNSQSNCQSHLIRNTQSHYVCNICGADFAKPSQLNDHMQGHNLAKTKDCCVCRHVLNMTRRARSLFNCQYCGQRFTRAYCCELHQQTCARRLGLKHDVTSSLMILR